MAVSLKHTTQAVGTDAGNGEIGKTQWNEEHALTLNTGKLVGRSTAGAGAAEEIAIGTGLSLTGGTLSSTVTANPGGSTTQLQYNNAGAFAGASGLTTDGTNLTITSGSLTLTGNISSAAWTTSGLRYKSVAATLTDTSSSGTVAAAYTNVYGGNTIAASNSTTFTDYFTTYVTQPTAGTNVTFTRRWALGLSGGLQVNGQATIPLQTLTDGTTIDWNCATAAKAKVTLGGNRTMNAVTNAVEGTSYALWVIQDGTGGRTLAYTTTGAGSFDFGTEGTPVLTTTASAADLLAFEAVTIGGTLKLRFCGIKRGFA